MQIEEMQRAFPFPSLSKDIYRFRIWVGPIGDKSSQLCVGSRCKQIHS